MLRILRNIPSHRRISRASVDWLVKKEIEDIELAIAKVELEKGNRDHTIKVLQDEIADQDEVINKLNKVIFLPIRRNSSLKSQHVFSICLLQICFNSEVGKNGW